MTLLTIVLAVAVVILSMQFYRLIEGVSVRCARRSETTVEQGKATYRLCRSCARIIRAALSASAADPE